MKIILKNSSEQPLYQQIKDQIKGAILRQELKEGEKLPSIRSLANDLHVSVLTTKRVYEELEKEGFIITIVGKGSFVASENMEMLLESKRHLVEKKLSEVWQMARTLGINKEELYSMMDIIFEEDDE
ncbi:GntR family transcriptional regulator [Aeribacillus sp. FSL K6-2848]|jgi:GntR family transcriptional regulator|uniref:GntR family transcriptional regulator n=1 Tax=Aeribacillus pallidus TaxID=33936 RepID=A0A161VZU7_9BACI|nr:MULTISPECIES: GntR family transcriptional regulator [Aeribacillus]ASS91254.1 GntR family transcriptional regulator [Aeribacillus pallidus]KZM53147.1 GntR family transcriptional regulator [Aeribacillus pallidus]MDR9794847.1 GntR family transcriptional regulator [Aeribacillus pallidus]MED0652447.1 GntR family transcriptional regulator [Aeribacillus composti]MED4488740.1 GntR family transcriptional regulator [Aeribacillus pallidus]